MSKHSSRFEELPNELIYDICKYLDAREVFHSFFNLNFRFKNLLKSFDHLQFTASLFDSSEKKNYEYFSIHIRTLIIDRGIDIDLKHFKKLYYLILRNPKEKLFEQLNHHSIPNIQYLSITHKFIISITDLHQKIFSNHFPHLKSCNLSDMDVVLPRQTWQQSLSLSILKVGQIDTFVYNAILSACPNLYFFQLKTSPLAQLPPNIVIHSNLKQLIIKDEDQTFPWNDNLINNYLLCVPNLDKLTIHRSITFKNLPEYLNYNWFTLIINQSLHLLRKFSLILYVSGSQQMTKCYRENVFFSLKEYFIHLHQNRYQLRIKFIEK